MDLSIIILNFNSKVKLINCLNSIFAQNLEGLRYEIIVVDNYSQDDLGDLNSVYSQVKFIRSSKNLGMGGGNNLGLESASGEFILVLNPDTVMRGGAISILFNYLKTNAAVGMVGPKILYPDGSLQISCSRFPSFFMPILRRTFLGEYFKDSRDRFTMNDYDRQSIRPVDWLMGSCLMFRGKMVLKSGETFQPRFDERFFMYFEDTDLARQIWTKGWRVVYNPEAIITHDHGRLSAKYPWYIAIWRDKMTWVHIDSWFKYFIKWGFKNKQKYAED